MRLRSRSGVLATSTAIFLSFCTWRMVRPFNIFTVMPRFERSIPAEVPDGLKSLSAEECGRCHTEIYAEWKQSIHSKASTEKYFQTDWSFDHKQQLCFHCHAPLDLQQESKIVGYEDVGRHYPIVEPNPDFDEALWREGVTCAACHVRDGKIVGPFEPENSPHPVTVDPQMSAKVDTCHRCHYTIGYPGLTFGAGGKNWTRPFAMCGSIEEMEAQGAGHMLGCPGCHMPPVTRPVVPGGKPREGRRHLFLGAHHPDFVRDAVDVSYRRAVVDGRTRFEFALENVGAPHYVPTGIPDRKIIVELFVLDADRKVLASDVRVHQRFILWKPFIVVVKDDRLPAGKPVTHEYEIPPDVASRAKWLDVRITFHLVGERRRRLVSFDNDEPVSFPIWRERIRIADGVREPDFHEGETRLCSGTAPQWDRIPERGLTIVPGGWKGDLPPEGNACEKGSIEGVGWPFY